MKEPRWLSRAAVLAIHGRLLAEHGGASGLRDQGLLESVLAAPRNHFEYDQADVFQLAATEPDAVLAVLALSRGELAADGFADWLKINSAALPPPAK